MRSRTMPVFMIVFYLSGLFVFFTQDVNASTPAEMADLSLQELFAIPIEEQREEDVVAKKRWKFGFIYKQIEFDGYLNGKTSISNDEVLFDGVEARTDNNFPVVPTVITQEAYIANFTYIINETSGMSLSVPLIRQKTDHISIVSGYDFFVLTSEGLGDVVLNYHKILKKWNKQQLNFSVGLSVPTGSIDETGDTPRAPGSQQLPYTMQLGSGTWDYPISLSYKKDETTWAWGGNILSKTHVGKNARNYRLGNRAAFSLWSKWRLQKQVQPSLKLVYQNWAHIVGQDDEITVPNAFPYPAAITNPNYYGGKKLNVSAGLDFMVGGRSITLEFSLPVYQSLNGIQSKEVFNASLNLSSLF